MTSVRSIRATVVAFAILGNGLAGHAAAQSVLRGDTAAVRRPASRVPVLRAQARDFAFTMPARITGGLRSLRLVNTGTEPHYLGLMRADSGKTAADFLAWRASHTSRPAWLTPVGGVAPVAPHDSAEIALELEPGRYIAFCTYPSPDGNSHLERGMVGEVVVTAPSDVDVEPTADATVHLTNYAFVGAPALRAGRQTLRVGNESDQLHQMLVIRLPEGVTPDDEITWFLRGSRGPRPGVPSGGVLQLPPGQHVWTTLTLRPGRYLLLCTVVERDGRPHHQLGMFSLLEVPGARGSAGGRTQARQP